jgi:hypothetical protein
VTSIYLSSFSFEKELSTSTCFTTRQESLIEDVLREASELLGTDAAELTLQDEDAERLGLAPATTYAAAYIAIRRLGDRAKAQQYTKTILGLRQDERVQGKEMDLTPEV